jgi:PEGA domain
MRPKMSLLLSLNFAILAATACQPISQPANPIKITLTSWPVGAIVYNGSMALGTTPFDALLPPGAYTLRFTLPGFLDEIVEAAVTTETDAIRSQLKPGPRLISLNDFGGGMIDLAVWDDTSDHLSLFVRSISPTVPIVYEAERRAVIQEPSLRSASDDPQLKASLNSRSPVFPSPNGEWLAFQDATTFQLVLHNTRTLQRIETGVTLGRDPGIQSIPFRLVWSRQGKYIWAYLAPWLALFVRIDDTRYESFNIFIFTSEEDGEVHVVDVLTPPLDNGLVLIRGRALGTEEADVWLYDLTTGKSRRLPVSGIYDAKFDAAGTAIIVSHHAGISRLSLDFSQRSELSNEVSSRWGIFAVKLSRDARYAFIQSGSSEAMQSWIYVVPLQ